MRHLERLGIIVTLLISLAGFTFNVGVVWTTVQQHGRDIDELRKHDEAQALRESGANDRLARIETKLDLLLGDGQQRKPRD